MLGWMQTGKHIARGVIVWAVLLAQTGFLLADDKARTYGPLPTQVVSINLCTDILAMQLAAPGQLISVSNLATDPHVSPMATEAGDYLINHGRAEEIYHLNPDLVLAASWTNPATLRMLEYLDVPVVVFDAANNFEDVRRQVIKMGVALGRQNQATKIVDEFDERLSALRARPTTHPGAVMFHANGLTTGDDSLSGQMLRAAGFDNLAANAGYHTLDRLSLEALVMLKPEVIITSATYPNASRSETIMTHPVVKALGNPKMGEIATDHDWFCGSPKVLDAVERLADIRAKAGDE